MARSTAPCPPRPPSTNAVAPDSTVVHCPLYGSTGVGVALGPNTLVVGVSGKAFGDWLWSVAGVCTDTASLTQDTALNSTYFDTHALATFTKTAVPLDECRLPGARLVTLFDALPDASKPLVAHTTRRLTAQSAAFCVHGITMQNGMCPNAFKSCRNGIKYGFCKKGGSSGTTAGDRYQQACTAIQNIAKGPPPQGDGSPCFDGPIGAFTNGQLRYDVRSPVVNLAIHDQPGAWCGYVHGGDCASWNNATIEQHAVKCQVTPPSATPQAAGTAFSNDKCLAGETDGNSGSLCAGLQCDPRQALGVYAQMYKAQGSRLGCLPWEDAARNTDGVMRTRCFTRGRNAKQQQAFPVSIKADVPAPVTSLTVPSAMVMFSTVEAPDTLPAGSSCACSAFDASLCECPSGSKAGCVLPSGQDPGISDGLICREWCGASDSNAACVAQANAACGADDAQHTAECACVNAQTTLFPGMAGKTYQEFKSDMAVNTGAAAPASVGATHCWWQPCQQAVDATGSGSYLPVAASTTAGCQGTNAVCAVNIVGMNVLRTTYAADPSQAHADAYAAAAASIFQSCRLCPPPPNVPTPERPAGCPADRNVCDCPGVDKAACMQQGGATCAASAGVWNVTVYNTAAQVVTVSTSSGAATATVVNPGDTRSFRVTHVVPKEHLTALWGVSDSLSAPMTGAARFDVHTAPAACIATYKTGAVVVVGSDAAAYAATVQACTAASCVTGLPPLHREPPSSSYAATVTVANFTGTSVTGKWDASGAANATHAVPPGAVQVFHHQTLSPSTPVQVNGGVASGGLRVAPVRFSAAPSVTQLNTQVWAALQRGDGSNAGVLAVFPDVTTATAYAQSAEAAVGKLPRPMAPGGGSAGAQYSVKVHNYTAVPAEVTLSGGTPVDVRTAYAWHGGILTSIAVNGTAVQSPAQSPAVTTATVQNIVSSLPQFAVAATQGTAAVVGVYATKQDAQAYTQLMQAAGKLLPPPAPSQLPSPSNNPGSPGSPGSPSAKRAPSKLRKTLKIAMWVVFAVLVCAGIPLLVVGGVRSKRGRR